MLILLFFKRYIRYISFVLLLLFLFLCFPLTYCFSFTADQYHEFLTSDEFQLIEDQLDKANKLYASQFSIIQNFIGAANNSLNALHRKDFNNALTSSIIAAKEQQYLAGLDQIHPYYYYFLSAEICEYMNDIDKMHSFYLVFLTYYTKHLKKPYQYSLQDDPFYERIKNKFNQYNLLINNNGFNWTTLVFNILLISGFILAISFAIWILKIFGISIPLMQKPSRELLFNHINMSKNILNNFLVVYNKWLDNQPFQGIEFTDSLLRSLKTQDIKKSVPKKTREELVNILDFINKFNRRELNLETEKSHNNTIKARTKQLIGYYNTFEKKLMK